MCGPMSRIAPSSWRHGDPAYMPSSRAPESQRAVPPLHDSTGSDGGEPLVGFRGEPKRQDDDAGDTRRADGVGELPSVIERGGDRLLEDQVTAGPGCRHGELWLHGRRDREGDDVDGVDQCVEVIEGDRVVGGGELGGDGGDASSTRR